MPHPDSTTANAAERIAQLEARIADLEAQLAQTRAAAAVPNLTGSEDAARMKLAVEAAGMGTWEVTLASGEATWSDARYAMLGYVPQGVTAGVEAWRKRVHLDDLPEVEAALARAIAEDGTYRSVHRILRADTGEIRWISEFATILAGKAGLPPRLIGVSFDVTAARQAELRLATREDEFRGLIETAPTLTFIYDVNRRRPVFVSPQCVEALGYTPEQVTSDPGETASTVLHPDDGPAVNAHLDAVSRGAEPENGRFFELEYRMRHRDGHWVWLLSRDRVWKRDAQGNPLEMLGVAVDITRLKTVEGQLRDREEQLRVFIDTVPAAVAMYDTEMRYLAASRRFIEDFRFPDPDIIGKSHYEVYPESTPEGRAIHRRVLGGATERSDAYHLKRTDGSSDWLQWELRPWYSNGEVAGLVIASEVITGRIEAEAHLRRSEQRFQLVTQSARVGYWDWDLRAASLEASAVCRQLFGFSEAERITYKSFLERIHPDDRAATDAALRECLASQGRRGYDTEFRTEWPGGGYWIHAKGDAIFEAGRAVRMAGILMDVTERKRAEVERERYAENLQRANDDLTHFAYAVSHDLKAPLRAVTTFAQLLQMRYQSQLPPQATEFIQMIADAGARMNTMMADLLEFAKAAGGELRVEPVDLNVSLTSALSSLAAEVTGTGAVIDAGTLPVVMANGPQMTRLFENLVGNSLKYRRPDVPVEVRVRALRRGGEWLISVSDNGSGFEPEFAGKIFGVFQRLHTDEVPGTGMGLTICRRIVERAGGRIWATAKQNRGAVFSFTLPATAGQLNALPGTTTNPESQSWSRAADSMFGELFETLNLAPAIVRDLDGTIRIWTKGAEAQFGWGSAEVQGKRTYEVLSTEFPEALAAIEAKFLRDGYWMGELRHRTAKGATVWHLSHWTLYRDGAGRPRSVIEINTDITALKDAVEAARRASEQRDLALRAGRMGVWTWHQSTDSVEWDEAMEGLLGLAAGSFGRTFTEFLERVDPEDRQRLIDDCAQALREGPEFEAEFRVRREGGDTRWVRAQGRVMFNERQQACGLTGVIWDVSQAKAAEAEIVSGAERVRRVLDSLFAFVGVTTVDGVLLEVNRAALEAAALRREDVVGIPIYENPYWSYSEAVQHKLKDALARAAGGELVRYDADIRVADGELISIDFYISPIRDDSGRVVNLVASGVPVTERKRVERALEASERLLRGTFDNAAVGIAHVSLNGQWLEVNRRLCDMFGYTNDELQALTFGDITHPDDLDADWAQARALTIGEIQSYSMDKRYVRKDGRVVWGHLTVSLLRDANGAPERFISIVEDISLRKAAESVMQDRDQNLRTMIDSIDQLAWMAHADGSIFWYNRRWYEYTGTTPEQMSGWGWRSVHDPEVLPVVMERWTGAIAQGVPFDMEFPLRGADGVYRVFLTRVLPVRDASGAVARWFGTNTNVDAIRKEQELLQVSEKRFRELADSQPHLVWECDAEGRGVYFNSRWMEYTGLTHEQSASGNWVIVHPEDAARLAPAWTASLTTGVPYEGQARLRRHDGRYRWFLSRAVAVKDEDGRLLRWLGTSADIHEQKVTEEALRRSNTDLEQFAYAASHDLREPLRMMSIYSEKLARTIQGHTGETKPFTEFIAAGAKRMDELLDGLLAYSRAGRSPNDGLQVSSREALEAALWKLEQQVDAIGAKVVYEDLPVVQAYMPALEQIFFQLLSNALIYRADGRGVQIRVSAAQGEGEWIFSVNDNGIGIKPAYLQQIFGVFKRLHREEYPGAGVGLAIAKRLVERQGGQIWAESEPGAGSTFYFSIPSA